jgi:hypothetical protein
MGHQGGPGPSASGGSDVVVAVHPLAGQGDEETTWFGLTRVDHDGWTDQAVAWDSRIETGAD